MSARGALVRPSWRGRACSARRAVQGAVPGQTHVVRAAPILPRPVLRETRAELATARERAGVRVISIPRCSGDFDPHVLATPEHRLHQITLTLPSPLRA